MRENDLSNIGFGTLRLLGSRSVYLSNGRAYRGRGESNPPPYSVSYGWFCHWYRHCVSKRQTPGKHCDASWVTCWNGLPWILATCTCDTVSGCYRGANVDRQLRTLRDKCRLHLQAVQERSPGLLECRRSVWQVVSKCRQLSTLCNIPKDRRSNLKVDLKHKCPNSNPKLSTLLTLWPWKWTFK